LDGHHDDGRREVLGGGLNAEERTVTHTMVGFAVGDTEAFCPDRVAILEEADGRAGDIFALHDVADMVALAVDQGPEV
jgi:hypothetical protein